MLLTSVLPVHFRSSTVWKQMTKLTRQKARHVMLAFSPFTTKLSQFVIGLKGMPATHQHADATLVASVLL